jgi:hypothetical protein
LFDEFNLAVTFVNHVDFAANAGLQYDRKLTGIRNAREFWRDSARLHATSTLQRVPKDEMSTMERLGETMPTKDDPVSVLLIEDDDTSMFNKYTNNVIDAFRR